LNKQFSQKNEDSKSNLQHNASNEDSKAFNTPNDNKQNLIDKQSFKHQKKSFEDDYERKRFGFKNYIIKMKGGEPNPQRINITEVVWTWCGIFLSIYIIFYIDSQLRGITSEHPLLFASMGASAVLIFGFPDSPYSQPRSVIGGHFVSALAGVTAYQLFYYEPVLAAAFAVSFASTLMFLTKTIHPPGGATALLAVIGSDDFHNLGYWFVISPCVTSTSILVILGVIINNLSASRKYPQYWW